MLSSIGVRPVRLNRLPCKLLKFLRLESMSRKGDDFCPFQAPDRRVQDVRGVKVTQKEQKSALYRPYCPLVHRYYYVCYRKYRGNAG